jgi:hypothetical protein
VDDCTVFDFGPEGDLKIAQTTTTPPPRIFHGRGFAVQAAVYWSAVAALRSLAVTPAAWCGLQVLVLLGWWVSCRWRYSSTLPPRSWAALAVYALLGAALFAGANFGMDALHGANRPTAQVAAHLGGVELWVVLYPGLLSLALGRLASCRSSSSTSQAPD